jgi:hypothetical protein
MHLELISTRPSMLWHHAQCKHWVMRRYGGLCVKCEPTGRYNASWVVEGPLATCCRMMLSAQHLAQFCSSCGQPAYTSVSVISAVSFVCCSVVGVTRASEPSNWIHIF